LFAADGSTELLAGPKLTSIRLMSAAEPAPIRPQLPLRDWQRRILTS
jgi:hypothetical protein